MAQHPMTGRAGWRPGRVHVVTGVGRSRYDDIAARQRHYLYAMTVRTIALILAFFVVHGWLRVIAIGLGLILPWISVTAANAGPEPQVGDQPEYVTPDLSRGIPEQGSEEASRPSGLPDRPPYS
jgi:hypothetical protein